MHVILGIGDGSYGSTYIDGHHVLIWWIEIFLSIWGRQVIIQTIVCNVCGECHPPCTLNPCFVDVKSSLIVTPTDD